MTKNYLLEHAEGMNYFVDEIIDYTELKKGEIEINYEGSLRADKYIEVDYIEDFITDIETKLSEAKMLLLDVDIDYMENVKKAFNEIDNALDDLI